MDFSRLLCLLYHVISVRFIFTRWLELGHELLVFALEHVLLFAASLLQSKRTSQLAAEAARFIIEQSISVGLLTHLSRTGRRRRLGATGLE